MKQKQSIERKLNMKDYYNILGVNQNAPDEVIKASYKALAKKYHPDLYDGDKLFAEHKMKEINEAYDILSDEIKRKEYDSSYKSSCNNNHFSNNSVAEDESESSQRSNNIYDDDNIIVADNKASIEIKEYTVKDVIIGILELCIIAIIVVAFIHFWPIINGTSSKDEKITTSPNYENNNFKEDSPEYTVNSLIDSCENGNEKHLFEENFYQIVLDTIDEQQYPEIFKYAVLDENAFMNLVYSSMDYHTEEANYIDKNTARVTLNIETVSFKELIEKAKESADKEYHRLQTLNKAGDYSTVMNKYEQQYISDLEKKVEVSPVFTLKKINNEWIITDCNDIKSFIKILIGNT
ncbi:MAG: J domain-containing protein [Hominimerdicola sp.]